jgi:hypothetical protein
MIVKTLVKHLLQEQKTFSPSILEGIEGYLFFNLY